MTHIDGHAGQQTIAAIQQFGTDVMFTLNDGHCAGSPSMEKWIDMQSTHGGLNRVNSDAVILSMVRPLDAPQRARDALPALFRRSGSAQPAEDDAGDE